MRPSNPKKITREALRRPPVPILVAARTLLREALAGQVGCAEGGSPENEPTYTTQKMLSLSALVSVMQPQDLLDVSVELQAGSPSKLARNARYGKAMKRQSKRKLLTSKKASARRRPKNNVERTHARSVPTALFSGREHQRSLTEHSGAPLLTRQCRPRYLVDFSFKCTFLKTYQSMAFRFCRDFCACRVFISKCCSGWQAS